MNGRKKMLPKKVAPKGLYLFCKAHDRIYKNDNVVKCNCKLKYKAKVHVGGTKKMVKTHKFQADNVEEAIQLFQQFKLLMKQNGFQRVDIKEKFVKPIFLLDCIDDFIKFKNGLNVPEHQKIILAKNTLRNYELCCEYMTYALTDNGIDVKTLRFESMNPTIVGYITSFIKAKVKANKTYNNYTSNIQEFAKYNYEKYYPELTNPFKKLKKFKENKDTRAVSKTEFLKLIEVIKPENGIGYQKQKEKMKKLNYYRPWLIDAFYIGIFAGGRNEETVEMKWSDIKTNEEGQMSIIEIVDYKRTRLEKDSGIENIQYTKTVEITPEFEIMLRELGYEEKKGSNEYILASNEETGRSYVKDLMSQAFTHFFGLLNLPIKKNFKHLRKTYITNCFIQTDDMKKFLIQTGHANINTPLSHYVDMKMVMEARRKKLYEEKSFEESNKQSKDEYIPDSNQKE